MAAVPPAPTPITAIPATVVVPALQGAVDRYCKSLTTSERLLKLHPRSKGHPSNAAALAPAIVLSTTAAFEGFAEDFSAIALAKSGLSFGEIAKKIGNWHNPHLMEFRNYMRDSFPAAASQLKAGVPIPIFTFTSSRGAAKPATFTWDQALTASRAWMQVRHHLTHGLTTGWRSERWYGPLKGTEPKAHEVLRPMGKGLYSLTIHGAITCARIYSIGAEAISNAVSAHLGETLDWSSRPEFN